jgi:enoyl-[acyl-carrier protein] reductase II
MFEGDLINGELEIGQASSQIREVHSASKIIKEIMNEFNKVKQQIKTESKFNF